MLDFYSGLVSRIYPNGFTTENNITIINHSRCEVILSSCFQYVKELLEIPGRIPPCPAPTGHLCLAEDHSYHEVVRSFFKDVCRHVWVDFLSAAESYDIESFIKPE